MQLLLFKASILTIRNPDRRLFLFYEPHFYVGSSGMHNQTVIVERKTSIISFWAWSFTVLLASSGHFARAEESGYQLGVFPHLAAGQIENMFAPMAADFSKALGRPVALKTKPTFEGFMAELDKQVYDIAFVQPFDYVWAHDKHGYIPLARRGELLAGLIVVKMDSPLRSLQDLKGKKVGLPPEVAAVSHLTKMALLDAKVDPSTDTTLQYYKAHDSCLQQLLIGEVDACGTAAYPVRFFENKWNIKFRVLGETQTIPHSLFIAHPRVPKQERDAIQKTILSWAETESGKQLLEKFELKSFIPATDAEYSTVRAYTRKMQKK